MAGRFRADVVGSFLRPQELLDARAAGLDSAELRAVEDRAIADVLRVQEEVGLPIATDGEFRRGHWTHLMLTLSDGFDLPNDSPLPLPVPVRPLRRIGSVVESEYVFVRARTTLPIKVTLPAVSTLAFLWDETRSADAYPTRNSFIAAVSELLIEEARALAAAGTSYLQFDSPSYAVLAAGTDSIEYRSMVAADNRVFGAIDGVVTGLHVCRGNYRRPADDAATPYDAYAAEVFGGLQVDRLLLEYDDYQAGDFAPLRHVPERTTVVLGLVTTKWPLMEDEDDLVRRIDVATAYVPLERLALSPQCGFASLATSAM